MSLPDRHQQQNAPGQLGEPRLSLGRCWVAFPACKEPPQQQEDGDGDGDGWGGSSAPLGQAQSQGWNSMLHSGVGGKKEPGDASRTQPAHSHSCAEHRSLPHHPPHPPSQTLPISGRGPQAGSSFQGYPMPWAVRLCLAGRCQLSWADLSPTCRV